VQSAITMNIYNPFILIPLISLVIFIYYHLPKKIRTPYLLFLSIAFLLLMDSRGVIFLLCLALVNFGTALYIEKKPNHKTIHIIGILLNILALVVPRLLNFITVANSDSLLDYLIPLGIAYIVLQNIGYLLDVNRGILSADHNFLNYLSYILFFPKLSSGPIEAARRFLPQVKQNHHLSLDMLQNAALRILFGLFKKLVIADRLALITKAVFDHPGQYQGLTVITAIFFYSFQIYFDFSGYSDIAIGTAGLFGYDLMENFNHPYLATSISDFWNRWHMSFTIWLREYIFFPLRRFFLKRNNPNKQFYALFFPPLVTMLVSGLWHGFSPTFILWGLFHGVLLFINELTRKTKKNPDTSHSLLWKRILTFSLVALGWILFRSNTLSDVGLLIQSIFVKSTTYHAILQDISSMDLTIALLSIPLIIILETRMVDANKNWLDIMPALRWAAYLLILISIFTLGVYQPWNTEFIYAGF